MLQNKARDLVAPIENGDFEMQVANLSHNQMMKCSLSQTTFHRIKA